MEFISKFSQRYKKYQYRFNLFKNLTRLRFHRFPDPSRIHITATGATDGGCAQLLRQLSTITFTRIFGFSYVHTPLSYVEHNIHSDPDWTDKWENFLQLSAFNRCSSKETGEFTMVRDMNELISKIIRHKKDPAPQYYQVRHCHSFTNRMPEAHLNILDELRESYGQSGRSLKLIYNNDTLNIAIHVRRGDVTKERMPERFTSAKKLKRIIQKIQEKLKHVNYKIYLFCTGLDEDLKSLIEENVRIVYELDIFEVMDHLIHADLLVSSKSSVGYVSAFISKAIIIYEPFWHPPLPGWLNMDEEFERELEKKIDEIQVSFPKNSTYSAGA